MLLGAIVILMRQSPYMMTLMTAGGKLSWCTDFIISSFVQTYCHDSSLWLSDISLRLDASYRLQSCACLQITPPLQEIPKQCKQRVHHLAQPPARSC